MSTTRKSAFSATNYRETLVDGRNVNPNDPYDAETIRLNNNFENWTIVEDISKSDPEEHVRRIQAMIKGEFSEDDEVSRDNFEALRKSTKIAMDNAYYPPALKSYNRATAIGKSASTARLPPFAETVSA